ncbi:nucleotide exchange factor GrpE [bacterium CG17_big_fil_post_rev_8_21_14_2_50_64_8]|nr:MAG: nucleotide exchange factor GrpE [bacterium CG17_big_fil_post_rev_8_21_14_2_50_64_8]PJA74218.1 MAG: nucleotide exchange factor GrpE [bacterium CG_4_9_14_3_um_filter_65_15]
MTASRHGKKHKKESSPEAPGSDHTPEAAAETADPSVVEADEADEEEILEPEAEDFDPLAVLARERDAFQEKWLRVVAEMDNLRKRSRRELADSRRLAQADVLRPILGVMDNFERALQSMGQNEDNADLEKFLEGVDLIFQNFQVVLRDVGVVPLEVLGTEFDPNFHEGVGQMPRDGVEPGQVIEVVQKGFLFKEQVLRPAKVIISA